MRRFRRCLVVVLMVSVPLLGAGCSTAPSSSAQQNQFLVSILTLIFCGTTSLPSCIISAI